MAEKILVLGPDNPFRVEIVRDLQVAGFTTEIFDTLKEGASLLRSGAEYDLIVAESRENFRDDPRYKDDIAAADLVEEFAKKYKFLVHTTYAAPATRQRITQSRVEIFSDYKGSFSFAERARQVIDETATFDPNKNAQPSPAIGQ